MRSLVLLAFLLSTTPALAQQPIEPKVQARIDRILKKTPLIDGHNDIAEQLSESHGYRVDNLASGTDKWPDHPLMTDMARLHQGRVGGQFWSVYIDGTLTGIGTTGGASISLTLKVLPTNVILQDENGQPLPAGATIDYEVAGPKEE